MAIKRMTITMPSDMAAAVKGAVADGEYASPSEVVREALQDWSRRKLSKGHELEALRADIETGLADVAQGRVQVFDPARIIARGKTISATRSRSA